MCDAAQEEERWATDVQEMTRQLAELETRDIYPGPVTLIPDT